MKLVLLASSVALAQAGPAEEYLAELRKSDPEDWGAFFQERLAQTPTKEEAPGVPRILMIGDSWTDVVGIGGKESYFEKVLHDKHGCDVVSGIIAIPGSTAGMWSNKLALKAVKLAVELWKPDYVWGTLVGNDALADMPACASTGKSEVECAEQLMEKAVPEMFDIVDTIHEAAPEAIITGFGYDTMFGGLGCSLLTRDIFPQCWGKDREAGSENRCFNGQFLRIQEGWGYAAGNRSYVDSATILGATQVAAGDPLASTDENDRHIDMDKMGPAKYWPTYLACFHPGIGDGDDVGAMVVMEEFYKSYWSKKLTCSGAPSVTV